MTQTESAPTARDAGTFTDQTIAEIVIPDTHSSGMSPP